MTLKRLIMPLLAAAVLAGFSGVADAQTSKVSQAQRSRKVFGVAFYNLENLFDTINNNGKYDLEFSPQGKNKWDGYK